MFSRLKVPLGTLLLLCLATFGWAQTGTGSIQGTVKDSSGAVIPAAKVTVVHLATNRVFTNETTGVGFYLFPSIQIGAYTVTVKAPGMNAWEGKVNLMAGQIASIDVSLQPATAETKVTVAGDVTPLVTTTSATVATVLERQRIEQLPVNGRTIQTLIYMTVPGTESGSVPKVYGLKYASEFVQDGAVLSNREYEGAPNRMPGLDTIGEFRAETSVSSAKMNRPGTFIMTTRSGSNEIHGTLFETARNSGIGVARARQDYYTNPPHLARNEFGASVGAPVFLPKLYNGKNRTFFFFSYEGFQLRQESTRSISLPTAAMRQGDFSGLTDGSGRSYTIYDPWSTGSDWSRVPYVNNQIPTTRQSPLAKYLYGITPMPNRPDNPLIASNWYGTGFVRTKQHTETARFDHRLTDKDQLTFRYTHSPSSGQRTSNPWGGSPTTLDGRANAYIDEGQNDNGAANWTHTFSPTFFSETLVTVSRDYRGQLPYTHGEEIASTLGLSNPFNGIGFPRMQYTFSGSGGMSYDSSINPTLNYAWITNVDQNFTKIYGRHEFQFGFRLRLEKLDTLEDQQETQGGVNFNSNATGLYDPKSGTAYSPVAYTGFIAANTYLGLGSYWARFNPSWIRLRNNEKSLYFQDNFKVNSHLSLFMGVRYEYNSPVNETNHGLIGFDDKSKSVVLGTSLDELAKMGNVLPSIAAAYQNLGLKYISADQAGLPSSLIHSNYYDFGPRAGFAYRFGSSNRPTVLRGGYSIFAYPESLRLFQGLTAMTVPSLGVIQNNPNLAEQSPDGLANYMLRSAPTIVAGQNSKNALDVNKVTGITRGSGSSYYMDPDQPTARAHQWNLTLERELMTDTVVKAGWIGTHGARMAQWNSYNDNPPTYVYYATTKNPAPTGQYASVVNRPFENTVLGTIQRYQKTGWSNDNSFQFEFEHRYSKGWAAQAYYVMSNAMRVAGDGWRDDTLTGTNQFMPGIVPADDNARNRLLYYRRDTSIPKHRVNWNFLVDLPIGKGKMIGRDSGRLLNALIGGWQVAGYGSLISRYFQLPTSYWGAQSDVQVYGKKYPIQDCRSGVCYDGWLYWNGYIPANQINSYGSNGKPNGVMGVPSDYTPVQKYINPRPANGGSSSDPLYNYYETNTVWITLNNGVNQPVAYNNGLHPLRNQFVLGPMRWNMSASAFKTVALTEKVALRVNVDFLDNVFNMPGTTLPGSDGIITNRNSDNSPRTLQLTMRLSW